MRDEILETIVLNIYPDDNNLSDDDDDDDGK